MSRRHSVVLLFWPICFLFGSQYWGEHDYIIVYFTCNIHISSVAYITAELWSCSDAACVRRWGGDVRKMDGCVCLCVYLCDVYNIYIRAKHSLDTRTKGVLTIAHT